MPRLVVTSDNDMLIRGVLVEICVQPSDRNCSIFRTANIADPVLMRARSFAAIDNEMTANDPAAIVVAIAEATITSRRAKPETSGRL